MLTWFRGNNLFRLVQFTSQRLVPRLLNQYSPKLTPFFMPLLCIAIPTFNRIKHLQKRIEELIPQLTDEVTLCVFDNGSNDGTQEAIRPLSQFYSYKRSEINLGMCRNFIRCFEESEGEWLWIVSDDDPVQPNSISKAIRLIKQFNGGIINFSTNCGENLENKTLSSLTDFFESKDITSIMHISANLYERNAIESSLKILAPTSFTSAPHAALIVHALQEKSAQLHLSTEELLIPEKNPRRWSALDVALGLSVFPEIVRDPNKQRLAALGIRASTRWMLLWGLVEIDSKTEICRWRRICRQVNGNLSSYGASLWRGLNFFSHAETEAFRREIIIHFLLIIPGFVTRFAAKLMKRKLRLISGEILSDFK